MYQLLAFAILLFPFFTFAYWIRKKPTSLWTGFWFLLFAACSTIILVVLIEQVSTFLAAAIAIPLAIILLFFAVFGIYAMAIALFWNERVLLKYERASFANFLPLIVGSAIILFQLIFWVVIRTVTNVTVLSIMTLINSCFVYFALLFILYALTSILFNLYPIRKPVDYIIILGAGLDKDKVTPLLASRIEAGLKLYNKQIAKGYQPTIILSGGQGADEEISEAQAMANYIQEKGYAVDKLYLEDKSTNTKENLLFSQAVAQEHDGIAGFSKKSVVVASNNYHILRAGKLAHSLGIPVRGVGSKTRLYYLPTAFIREYVGYLVLTKRIHQTVIGILCALTLIPVVFDVIGFLVEYFSKNS